MPAKSMLLDACMQAVALECMRQAHRQQRACYLYAFSGPRDVKELELKVDASSLAELLNFLKYSFDGGTDVDRPLELSLERLEQKDWSQVSSAFLSYDLPAAVPYDNM